MIEPDSGLTLAAPRVCWMTTEFFPPQMGGTGIITARLAEALAARGIQVTVVTRQTLPRCAAEEQIGRVQVRRIGPAGVSKGAGWRAVPAMLAYLTRIATFLVVRASHYDLVIIAGMKTIPLAAVPFCRLLRKKCIVRIESPAEITEPIAAESLATMGSLVSRVLNRVLGHVQRFLLRRADRVIAISEDIAIRLRDLGYPEAAIARIPNAVDLRKFAPVSAQERDERRMQLGFPDGKTIVLYAGRLSRSKGVMMLMQSLPELLAGHPDLHLVLVGSGRDSWDDCEDEVVGFLREQRLGAQVTLAGQSERVHEYLQAADLFVSPSDYEGFGLTIVEALACALPVVTTAVGVACQVVRDDWNGFLCPARDRRAFSAAIELALRERQRWPEIGQHARAAAMRFDVPQVIGEYLALCLDLHTPNRHVAR